MKTFYQSSATQQSLLMVFLFLALLLILILSVIMSGTYHDRRKQYLNVAVFLFLFFILGILTDFFSQTDCGKMPKIRFPVPIFLLWGIVACVNLLCLWEMIGLHRLKGQGLNRNSVKEAMDRIPSGICYFTKNGSVKLCNLQMYRLFHSLAGKDLQNLSELKAALDICGSKTNVICLSKELQNYLFPDGRVWRYRESLVKDEEGITYTEAVFSDLTEQYERELELKKRTKDLKEISRKLRRLSDNALILTREKEILAAKTKLHDQMGAGLTAIRQILQHQEAVENENAVGLLRQAVSAVKNDNEYPPEKDELAKFIQDAGTVGVKVNLDGNLPECEELSFVFLIAMRECLSNGVRYAGAAELWIDMREDDNIVSIHITNDGMPPESEIVPKGGLQNLYRFVLDCGGKMKIQSKPSFALTVTLPKEKEGKE